jgi:hypothetical protein
METQVESKPMPTGLAKHLQEIQPKPQQADVVNIPVPDVAPVEEPVAETPAPAPVVEANTAVTETPAQGNEAPAEDDWLSADAPMQTEANQPTNSPSAEEKAKAFDALFSNPQVELVLKAFQAGKTLEEIAKEYQVVDYNSMDVESLSKAYGQLQGYSDDEVEATQEWLDSLPTVQRTRELNAMKSELGQLRNEKMKTLSQGYEKTIADEQAVQRKLETDIAATSQAMIGKDLFGATITKKDADDFQKWVRTDFANYVNPDGTYNVNQLRNFWLGAVKIPSIQKANFAKGKTEGVQEVLKEVHRPSLNSAAPSRLPQANPVKTAQEEAREAVKKMAGFQQSIITKSN